MCEAARLKALDKVLDIGTATGNAALAAARRQCQVTAIDTDTAMLEVARRRATANI